MPYLTASQPGDPAEIGGYRVRGRLGEGGQGVVYLAETGGGDLVAIKRLRAAPDPVDAARFRREAEVLPRVASFCTAQVLATGTADGVPYIVSEYIDGPSLQRAVRERGPLRGRELRGLAIGTITALAAIHRAGVVHRDFKPGNVLLAADGPRVIDFGIARAVDGDATGGGPVGTPSYMAPEQFGDEPAGPPADLFAWGATMVFAATGHPPFGADSLAAIVHRILTQEPDLGELEGELRDIVAGCLAKDPAARPRAGEVLLRLLGHPAGVPSSSDRLLAQGTAAAVPDAAVPEPSRRRTGGWWALGAVAVAAALIVTVALVRGREPGATITSPTPVPRPSPLLSGPPPAAAGTVSVPALRATLHEHPSDPLRLTSFLVEEGGTIGTPAYVRDPGTNTFRRLDEYLDPVVSPDGATVAAIYGYPEYVPEDGNAVRFTDRATGDRFSVPTVELPLVVKHPHWSPDGKRLLLTAQEDGKSVGFVVVDVAARRAELVRAGTPGAGSGAYLWLPGGDGVVVRAGDTGVRAYTLRGAVMRTYDDVVAADSGDRWFTPSGRWLAGLCPGKSPAACVLDTKTGERRARVPLPDEGVLWGWFNEDHLLVYHDGTAGVYDLAGRRVRVLAEIGLDRNTYWLVHFTTGP